MTARASFVMATADFSQGRNGMPRLLMVLEAGITTAAPFIISRHQRRRIRRPEVGRVLQTRRWKVTCRRIIGGLMKAWLENPCGVSRARARGIRTAMFSTTMPGLSG